MQAILSKCWNPGLMAGLWSTLFLVLLYLGGIDMLANFWLAILTYPILFTLMFFYANRIRKDLKKDDASGNFVFTYGNAFVALFAIGMIASAVMSVWNISLYNIIDKDLAGPVCDRIIEQSLEMMDKRNIPESAKQEAMARFENIEDQFTVSGILLTWIKGSLFMALIAAIGAAFIRDKKQLS